MSFTENVKIEPCRCGDPICKQFRLSTQGTVGFSEADARLYAGAPLLFHAATECRKAQRTMAELCLGPATSPKSEMVRACHDAAEKAKTLNFALAQCVGDFDTPPRPQDNPTFVMLEPLRYIEERVGRTGWMLIDDDELKTHLARVRPFLEGGA